MTVRGKRAGQGARRVRPLLGIIGGSGLYDLPELKNVEQRSIRTPFGAPSGKLILGDLGATRLAFIARHGPGHRLMPSEINYRANVWALKKLGAERVLAFSAVGSMREELPPGDMVVVGQYIDQTRCRPRSFFGEGVVAHVPLADPTCPAFSEQVARCAEAAVGKVRRSGTYVCIEGPQFSTRAESALFRSWGVDVIGMTNLPEARLAREAELCYASLALCTDYDCWHANESDVSAKTVVEVMKRNVENARKVIRALASDTTWADALPPCACPTALDGAIMTTSKIPTETGRRLALLLERARR